MLRGCSDEGYTWWGRSLRTGQRSLSRSGDVPPGPLHGPRLGGMVDCLPDLVTPQRPAHGLTITVGISRSGHQIDERSRQPGTALMSSTRSDRSFSRASSCGCYSSTQRLPSGRWSGWRIIIDFGDGQRLRFEDESLRGSRQTKAGRVGVLVCGKRHSRAVRHLSARCPPRPLHGPGWSGDPPSGSSRQK